MSLVRRVCVSVLVIALLVIPPTAISQTGGGGGGGSAPPFFYRVTNGATTEVLQALVDGQSAVDFYGYSSGDSSSHTGFEATQTLSIFLWSGPEGKSLVFMADEANDGSGGTLKVVMAGLPVGAGWVVKDDPTGDTYTANSATWTWIACCTDGGVMGLATNDAVALNLTFPTVTGLTTFRLFGGPANDPQFVTFDPSKPLLIETFQTPSAPGLVGAPGPGVGEITLTATPPSDDGGDPVTSYAFYDTTTTPTLVGTSETGSLIVTGLGNGANRSFTARAVNLGGTGDASATVDVITFDVPAAPESLVATASTTEAGTVHLAWDPPTSDGGLAINGYVVYRDGTPAGTTTSTVFLEQSLFNGVMYTYTVAAENAAGIGPSAQATVTTVARPSNPENVTVTTGPGAGELTLAWDAPANDGGAPVAAYRIERDGIDLGDHESGFVDTGLTRGTTHTYAVYARNAAGEGPSGAASGTTLDVPSEPLGVNATTPVAVGTIDLSWSAPLSDGGTTLTGYEIFRDGGPVAIVAANRTSYTDTGLENGTTHAYAIRATNLVGAGPVSTAASATTIDVPDLPQNLSVASGSSVGTIDLAWWAPADDNGAPITDYIVYAGSGPDDLAPIANVTATAHTDSTGILPESHYYAVAARNLVGEGARTPVDCGAPAPYGPLTGLLCR